MLMTKSSSLESVLLVLSSPYLTEVKYGCIKKKRVVGSKKPRYKSLSGKKKRKRKKKLHQGEAREGRTAREGVRFSWPKSEIFGVRVQCVGQQNSR